MSTPNIVDTELGPKPDGYTNSYLELESLPEIGGIKASLEARSISYARAAKLLHDRGRCLDRSPSALEKLLQRWHKSVGRKKPALSPTIDRQAPLSDASYDAFHRERRLAQAGLPTEPRGLDTTYTASAMGELGDDDLEGGQSPSSPYFEELASLTAQAERLRKTMDGMEKWRSRITGNDADLPPMFGPEMSRALSEHRATLMAIANIKARARVLERAELLMRQAEAETSNEVSTVKRSRHAETLQAALKDPKVAARILIGLSILTQPEDVMSRRFYVFGRGTKEEALAADAEATRTEELTRLAAANVEELKASYMPDATPVEDATTAHINDSTLLSITVERNDAQRLTAVTSSSNHAA